MFGKPVFTNTGHIDYELALIEWENAHDQVQATHAAYQEGEGPRVSDEMIDALASAGCKLTVATARRSH